MYLKVMTTTAIKKMTMMIMPKKKMVMVTNIKMNTVMMMIIKKKVMTNTVMRAMLTENLTHTFG